MNDPIARAAELAAIGHLRPAEPDDTARALAACKEPDARVRAAALGALARSADGAVALDALRVALDDGDAAVRRRAAEIVPTLPAEPHVVDALVGLLRDRDVTVVEAAAWALGELGAVAVERGAVSALIDTVRSHRDALAREAAVAALGALGDDEAIPAIIDACHDRPAVRRRAVLALAPFSGPAVDAAVAAALDDRDWQVRQAAEDLQRAQS